MIMDAPVLVVAESISRRNRLLKNVMSAATRGKEQVEKYRLAVLIVQGESHAP